jgi:hypothetical protein
MFPTTKHHHQHNTAYAYHERVRPSRSWRDRWRIRRAGEAPRASAVRRSAVAIAAHARMIVVPCGGGGGVRERLCEREESIVFVVIGIINERWRYVPPIDATRQRSTRHCESNCAICRQSSRQAATSPRTHNQQQKT